MQVPGGKNRGTGFAHRSGMLATPRSEMGRRNSSGMGGTNRGRMGCADRIGTDRTLSSSTGLARRRQALALLALVILLSMFGRPASAAASLEGRWSVNITIPQSPAASATTTLAVTLDVSPIGDSLIGRLTVTDSAGRTVAGVWRQVGKAIFMTYELPCAGVGSPCATLIIRAKIKGDRLKNGKVIVMWDSQNNQNPALYDTSNGFFTGDRVTQ